MTDSELSADAALIRRVLSGQTDAFNVLIGRYLPEAARFAYRMLGNRQDAEDALQEAALKAYRALGGYREQDAFRAWYFRILANQCRDLARRRRRHDRRFSSEEPTPDAGPGGPPRPADGAVALARRDALQQALDRLDPRMREAILLKHGEGLEYAEIARITGVGVSALKMRVKRGCEILRPWLEWKHDD